MYSILEKIKFYWKYVLFISLVLMVILGVYLYQKKSIKVEEKVDNDIFYTPQQEVATSVEMSKSTVFVDIKGAVKKPGVYELEDGSRVIDVIKISGGLNKNADTSTINLSKKLEDGNVVIIYTKDKIAELQKQEVIIEYIEKECNCIDISNSACLDQDDVVNENNTSDNGEISDKISLNSATKEQLMTLSGIGESKALDIINYRKEIGKFNTIDDIKEVKGIGDALFNKIKEFITI